RRRPSALKTPSRLGLSEPFFRYRLPRNGPPPDRPEFPVTMKRVTVKYRVIQYSSRPDLGQARADASAPRTSGSQAAAHDPRAARPGTAPDVQEETNRCRAGDGDHAGGRESLQYPEPRRRSGNAPSVPGDHALRARTRGEHRGRDDPLRSDCEGEPILFEPHVDRPLLRVPQGDGGHRSPLHGVFSFSAEAVGLRGISGPAEPPARLGFPPRPSSARGL